MTMFWKDYTKAEDGLRTVPLTYHHEVVNLVLSLYIPQPTPDFHNCYVVL